MAQEIITLECTEAKALGKPVSRYMTTRNKKSPRTPNRLEKKKYNPFLGRHTLHRETKKRLNAAKNSKAPFCVPPRQSSHATAPDRYCSGSTRLQEPRSVEEIRKRERQNSSPSRDRHARIHAPQDHARDQAQPLGALNEIERP